MSRRMLVNPETVETKLVTTDDFILLDRAYTRIYLPAFPKADQRESLTDLKKYIQHNSPLEEYQILITQHISSAGYQRPLGMATANCLSDAEITIAFFEYAAVHPSYQGQGLWNSITRARTRCVENKASTVNTALAAIFTETEKPHLFSSMKFSDAPEDTYYHLDFNYVQLPVRDDAQSVHNLSLLARFASEERDQYLQEGISPELMLRCLHLYFNSFEVEYDYREHPDFKQMEKEIKQGNVRLRKL